MNKRLIVLLAFCVTSFAVCLWAAIGKDSAPAYSLAGLIFVVTVAVYAAEALGYIVKSKYLALQKQVSSLEQENTALQSVTTALIKSFFMLHQAEKTWEGAKGEHYKKLREYLSVVADYIEGDPLAEVISDIAGIKTPPDSPQ